MFMTMSKNTKKVTDLVPSDHNTIPNVALMMLGEVLAQPFVRCSQEASQKHFYT